MEEQEKNPDDEMLRNVVTDLKGKYGDDIADWPKVGCGAQFSPWKKGASMVVEIKQEDGSWDSVVAERLPSELDDAIKGHHAAYYMAQKDLTPEELLDVLPMAFPMTHAHPEFPGIAKYPVDAWEKPGAPTLTPKSWRKLAMRAASRDTTNLAKVFEVAKTCEEKDDKEKALYSKGSS